METGYMMKTGNMLQTAGNMMQTGKITSTLCNASYLNFLLAVKWLLVACVSSSRCRRLVCGVCDYGVSWSYSLIFFLNRINYGNRYSAT